MANRSEDVNAFMTKLDHPLKAEIETVRSIILEADPKVEERVKWNSPSFYYKKDILAIHVREQKFVHLVFVYPVGLPANEHGMLQGDFKDRRMAYFHSMAEIGEKKEALRAVIREWVELMDFKS